MSSTIGKGTVKQGIMILLGLWVLLALPMAASAESFSGTATLTPSTGSGLSINLIEPDGTHYKSGDNPHFRYLVSYNKSLTLGCGLSIDGSLVDSVTVPDGEEEISSLSLSLAEGQHTWEVSCSDSANNSATSSTKTFTADLTKPSITLDTGNPAISLVDSIQLNFTPTDNLASTLTCDLDVNGGVNQSGLSIASGSKKSVTLSDLENGTYTWQATCVDQAGNSKDSATHTFYIDTKRNFSIIPNKQSYNIGEGGLYIVTAPYGGSVTVLITDPKSNTITREYGDTFPVFGDIDFLDHPGSYTLDGFLNYNGAVKTTSSSFTVKDSFTVDVTVNSTIVGKDSSVTFEAKAEGGIGDYTYKWEFGDGGTSSSKIATHSYGSLGKFAAKITVTDSKGNAASETVSMSVEDQHDLTIQVKDKATLAAIQGASVYLDGDKRSTNSEGKVTYKVFSDSYGVLVSHEDYGSVFNRTDVVGATTLNVYLVPKGENQSAEPAQVASQETAEEQEPAEESESATAGSEGELDPESLRGRAGVLLGKVNDALENLDQRSSEEEHLINRLRIRDRLENAKLNLQRVDRDLHNLEENRRGLTDEEVAKQREGIKKDVETMERSTITSVSVIDSTSSSRYAGTETVAGLSDTYLELMNISPKRSVKKDYVEENIKLQSAVAVSSTIQVASIGYLNGQRQTITVVSDAAEMNSDVTGAKYVVSIPKELALSVEEIEFLTSHEVLEDDPMVAFDLANTPDITYYFRKDLEESQVKKISAALLMVPDQSMDSKGGFAITGFAVFSSLSDIDNPVIVLEVLAIIVLLGIYLVYEFDLWDRIRKLLLFSKRELKEVRDIMQDIETCLEHNEPDNGAVEYQDLMDAYKKLSKEGKKRVYKEIEELHYKILMAQLNHYIDEALANADEDKMDQAREQYASIQDLYRQLPKTHKALLSNRCAILLKKLGAQ